MVSAKTISRYDELLARTQAMLSARHQEKWAAALNTWRAELKNRLSPAELRSHAQRTARALGGMESIGEIALGDNDQEFLRLVEDLFAICKEIIE